MNTPLVEYVAEAGQTEFDVPFPYLSPDHVEVRANGIQYYPVGWTSPTRLRLAGPPGAGSLVDIRRNTPIVEQLVKFTNGAVLTEEDLNLAVEQLLFKQQEVLAYYDATLTAARVRIGQANGVVASPQDIAQEIANLVLEQDVLNEFRQRVADIDLNAAAIVQQASNTDTISDNLSQLRADHEALAGVVAELDAIGDGSGVSAIIDAERDARISGDNALAATIGLIGAKNGDSSAFILDTNRVKVSSTESLSQRLAALSATDGSNNAAIQAEATTRANADTAIVTSLNTLSARMGTAESAIVAEQTARADAVSAEASARTSLAATLRGETSAAVASEATARSNADGVFAQNFALLGVRSPDGTAFILNQSTTQLSGGVSLVTRLSGLDSRLDTNAAAVASEASARTTADGALSTRIDNLTTTVNGNTASVTTLSSSLNGVFAKWGVTLDVNGYITGVQQLNDGSTSAFNIVADRFSIVTPSGAKHPFTVTGDVVEINATLKVDVIEAGMIKTGAVTTDKLAPNAVSVVAQAYNGSRLLGTNNGPAYVAPTWQDAITLNLAMPANGDIILMATASAFPDSTVANYNSSNGWGLNLVVEVDGTRYSLGSFVTTQAASWIPNGAISGRINVPHGSTFKCILQFMGIQARNTLPVGGASLVALGIVR